MSITDELNVGIFPMPSKDEMKYFEQQEHLNSGETAIATVSQLHNIRSIDDAIILSADVFERMKEFERIETILEAGYKLRVFAEEFEKLARREIIPLIPKAGIEIGGIKITEKNLPRKYVFQMNEKYKSLLKNLEEAKEELKKFETQMKNATEKFFIESTGEEISPAVEQQTGTTTVISFINNK